MKFKIYWQYYNKNGLETEFISDWINGENALQIAEDIEKTNRVKHLRFLDETELTWSKKEVIKLLKKIENEPDEIHLFFDGSYHKETGEGGIGLVVYYQLGKEKIRHRLNQKVDQLYSNNEAEYIALYNGLLLLDDLKIHGKKVVIKGDSQGLLMQLRGEWPCYEENLNQWLDRIETKIKKMNLYPIFEPIPRTENKEADKLARQAIQNIRINSKNLFSE